MCFAAAPPHRARVNTVVFEIHTGAPLEYRLLFCIFFLPIPKQQQLLLILVFDPLALYFAAFLCCDGWPLITPAAAAALFCFFFVVQLVEEQI